MLHVYTLKLHEGEIKYRILGQLKKYTKKNGITVMKRYFYKFYDVQTYKWLLEIFKPKIDDDVLNFNVGGIDKQIKKEDYSLKNNVFRLYRRPMTKTFNRIVESTVQRILEEKLLKLGLNPALEVPTPFGRIDILTDDSIIEIKSYCRWKDAVGQVQAYGYFYPGKKMRIHLFDVPDDADLTEIRKFMKTKNIELTL